MTVPHHDAPHKPPGPAPTAAPVPASQTAEALAAAIAQRCDQATLQGDTWQACCPAHDDTHPSLSITAGEDKALLHCFTGCAPEAIVAALGLEMRDLFVARPAVNGHRRILAVYPYVDAHGQVLHETVRYDTPSKKGFQALAPEKVRLADNDGLMPRDESEGVFPEKVPFRERFL